MNIIKEGSHILVSQYRISTPQLHCWFKMKPFNLSAGSVKNRQSILYVLSVRVHVLEKKFRMFTEIRPPG